MKHLTILLFAAWVLFSVTGPAFAVPDAAVPETADTPAASEPSSGASDPAAAVSEGSPFQPGAVSADPQAKTASEPVSSESGAPVSAPDDYAVYCVMPDAARSSLSAFRLGMTVEEAQTLGAAPPFPTRPASKRSWILWHRCIRRSPGRNCPTSTGPRRGNTVSKT